MADDLIIHGPFEIPHIQQSTGSAKHIDKEQAAEFLKMLDTEGIAEKQGCYVFALKASKGYMPWYIGKATKSMRQECIAAHQLTHYNGLLFKGYKGTPVMFFVAPDAKKKKVPKEVCDEIETYLIQFAYRKNPDIRNVQKTNVPEWSIDGVVRSKQGKPTAIASAFKTMLAMD